MSRMGCPGYLAKGHRSASDVHSERDQGGLIGARQDRVAKLCKVICVLHICYLAASPSLTFWIRFPASLPCRFSASHSLPPSVWRSSLPSPSVSWYATHGDGGRWGRGATETKSEEGKCRASIHGYLKSLWSYALGVLSQKTAYWSLSWKY